VSESREFFFLSAGDGTEMRSLGRGLGDNSDEVEEIE